LLLVLRVDIELMSCGGDWIMLRVANLICVVVILLAGCLGTVGCTSGGVGDNPGSSYSPFSWGLSFPQGAPRLNQSAELLYKVEARSLPIDNASVSIVLPDGVELLSGELEAHFGNISIGDTKRLSVIIKPTKIGNYTIEAKLTGTPQDKGYDIGPGESRVYLEVSSNSAEWGAFPPWTPKTLQETPPGNRPPPPSTVPTVHSLRSWLTCPSQTAHRG
jgi:hypothetical protein